MNRKRPQYVSARGQIALALLAATSLCGVALAQGNGSSPKGQPFIEIQGQFVEVVGRIENLEGAMDDVVGRVDNLEDRVGANESAITGLQAENAILAQQVTDVITQAAANSADIQAAIDSIAIAESEIDTLQMDAAANASAIMLLEDEITALQNFVAVNTSGLQSLLTRIENNEELIDGLSEEIVTINASLALKQDILDGQCDPGSALSAIDPDGGITCEEVGSGLTRFDVTRTGYVSAAYSYQQSYSCGTWGTSTCYRTVWVYPQSTATATCPAGSFITGGSALNTSNLTLRQNSSQSNSWVVRVQNYRTYGQYFYSRANCIGIN